MRALSNHWLISVAGKNSSRHSTCSKIIVLTLEKSSHRILINRTFREPRFDSGIDLCVTVSPWYHTRSFFCLFGEYGRFRPFCLYSGHHSVQQHSYDGSDDQQNLLLHSVQSVYIGDYVSPHDHHLCVPPIDDLESDIYHHLHAETLTQITLGFAYASNSTTHNDCRQNILWCMISECRLLSFTQIRASGRTFPRQQYHCFTDAIQTHHREQAETIFSRRTTRSHEENGTSIRKIVLTLLLKADGPSIVRQMSTLLATS